MASQKFENKLHRFIEALAEMDEMIADFSARSQSADFVKDPEFLSAIEALGRAGARIYNAQKAMAGDASSLRNVKLQFPKG